MNYCADQLPFPSCKTKCLICSQKVCLAYKYEHYQTVEVDELVV